MRYTFPGCQLASAYETWPDQPVLVEPKLDGYRMMVLIHQEGDPTIHCRDAKPPSWAENVMHIVEELAVGLPRSMAGWLIDGEVMAEDWGHTSKLLRRKRANMDEVTKEKIRQTVRFFVFDAVPMQPEWDEIKLTERSRKAYPVCSVPFSERRALIEEVFGQHKGACVLAPQFRAETEPELHALFDEMVEMEYEGAMVKLPDAPYAFTRSPFWLKMKPFKTMELMIIGFQPGEGRHVGRLGAFICANADGDEIRVGGGFTDAQRDDYWIRREEIRGAEIEIKCQNDNVAKARHPVFVRFREDRNALSVHAES